MKTDYVSAVFFHCPALDRASPGAGEIWRCASAGYDQRFGSYLKVLAAERWRRILQASVVTMRRLWGWTKLSGIAARFCRWGC